LLPYNPFVAGGKYFQAYVAYCGAIRKPGEWKWIYWMLCRIEGGEPLEVLVVKRLAGRLIMFLQIQGGQGLGGL